MMSERTSINNLRVPGKKRFFLSIRAKMLIYFGSMIAVMLLIFVLVDIYGIPFTTFRGVYKKEQADAFQNLSLVADLKKERLLRWIRERMNDTSTLAGNSITTSCVVSLLPVVNENIANGVRGEALLAELQKEESYHTLTQQLNLVKETYGVYDKVQIADALTGIIIVSTRKEDLGMDISLHNSFTNILQTGSHEAINIVKDQVSGNLELLVSHAIYRPDDEYKLSSVLIMHINPDDLIKPMLHTGGGLGQTGEALLVNYDVKILTALKFPLADGTTALPLEYQIKAKPATLAAQGEEGIITAEDYRGKKVLAAFRHARLTSELGWGLVIKRDMAEVFAPVRESIYYRILIGSICASLMFILTTLIARSLTRPIQSLSKAVQSMKEGNLNVQAHITTHDEVSTLASSFNVMVHSLKQTQEELVRKEKFATIGRISGSIAHDVRHPLATIKNSAYFLNMTLKDPNEKTKKHLKLIDSEVAHANEIITSLMRLSELKKPEKSKTNISEFVREYFSEFPLPEHIKLVTEFDNKYPDILVDQSHLKQVFTNLASNAVQAMPEDGKLIVKTRRVRPSASAESQECEGDFVEISFADTGSGIRKDTLDKVFEPFYTTKTKGIGLGLSIVNDIITANDGNITVESEEGKGSTFKMMFPGVRD